MTDELNAVYEQIRTSADYFHKAKLIGFLVKQKNIRIKDVAEALKLKPAYVCHILRLNKLSELIMDGYYSHLISISHLFVLSLLHTQEDIMELYEVVLRENLTVKATEDRVRTILHNVQPNGEYITHENVERAVGAIRRKYNVNAKVIQTRVKTKIILEWKGSRADRKKDVELLLETLSSNEESK